MAEEKRLFWLQLKNTYFNQLTQKKMRKQQSGLEMQVIYLRMMLLSLDNNGYIFYQGVYNSIEEELAEEFNEPVELVKQTIDFLIENKMIKTDKDDGGLFIPEALECTVSKGASAIRMERMRAKNKTSQCDNNVTTSDDIVTAGDTYKDKNKVREEKESNNTLFNSLTFKEGETLSPSAGAGEAFSPFTLSDCEECAVKGKVNLSENGIQAFYERMQKDGWKINKEPVTNLLMAMRGFAKNHKRYQKNEPGEKSAAKISISSIMSKAKKYMGQELIQEYIGDCENWLEHIPEHCPKDIFTDEELEFFEEKYGVSLEDW